MLSSSDDDAENGINIESEAHVGVNGNGGGNADGNGDGEGDISASGYLIATLQQSLTLVESTKSFHNPCFTQN